MRPPPRWLLPVRGGGAGERRGESSIRLKLPTSGAKVIHPYASHLVTLGLGKWGQFPEWGTHGKSGEAGRRPGSCDSKSWMVTIDQTRGRQLEFLAPESKKGGGAFDEPSGTIQRWSPGLGLLLDPPPCSVFKVHPDKETPCPPDNFTFSDDLPKTKRKRARTLLNGQLFFHNIIMKSGHTLPALP